MKNAQTTGKHAAQAEANIRNDVFFRSITYDTPDDEIRFPARWFLFGLVSDGTAAASDAEGSRTLRPGDLLILSPSRSCSAPTHGAIWSVRTSISGRLPTGWDSPISRPSASSSAHGTDSPPRATARRRAAADPLATTDARHKPPGSRFYPAAGAGRIIEGAGRQKRQLENGHRPAEGTTPQRAPTGRGTTPQQAPAGRRDLPATGARRQMAWTGSKRDIPKAGADRRTVSRRGRQRPRGSSDARYSRRCPRAGRHAAGRPRASCP